MTISLTGRRALVIGGSGGIGAACVRLLAEAGAQVAFTHTERSHAAAAALLAELPGAGHRAFVAEITDTASLLALRAALQETGEALHILVNAAGFTKPVAHADLDGLDDDLIDELFRVNWRGQFATIRTFAPMLQASNDGLVVNISSISGQTGVGSSIAYCATKAGTDVMTKSLARALAPKVRVLGVAPGVVDTGFVAGRTAEVSAKLAAGTPLKRIASPEDVAQAVLACATHLGFATGTTLVVDGGRSL
jgi:3-oxoacyl-[acyl-carrier protein] reductase